MSIAIMDAWNAAGPPRKPSVLSPESIQPHQMQPIQLSATTVPIGFHPPHPRVNEGYTQQHDSDPHYQQELSRTQMEQVTNYLSGIIGNAELHISKKVDVVGKQVAAGCQDASDDHSSKLDRVLSMTYIITALVILSAAVTIGTVLIAHARSTSNMLDEFRAVCKNVLRSSTLS